MKWQRLGGSKVKRKKNGKREKEKPHAMVKSRHFHAHYVPLMRAHKKSRRKGSSVLEVLSDPRSRTVVGVVCSTSTTRYRQLISTFSGRRKGDSAHLDSSYPPEFLAVCQCPPLLARRQLAALW